MRILLAVDAPSSHLFPLPFGWADRGHDVTILMDRPDGRFGHAREHPHPGVRQLTWGRGPGLLDAVSEVDAGTTLRELIAGHDAVVIGGYSARSARAVLVTPPRARPHTIMLAERPDPRTAGIRRLARDAWIRRCLRRMDAVWSMSVAGDEAFSALGLAPDCRIPYPIEVPVSPDRDPVAHWRGGERRRILILGKLIDRKRPLVAVEVVRDLIRHGVDVEATVVGTGPLEREVRAAAAGLPITVTGQVGKPVVDQLLDEAHLLLHPAIHDGWGMAVAEAAANGTPVVATAGCDAAAELAAPSGGTVRTAGPDAAELEEAVRDVLDDFASRPADATQRLLEAVRAVCGTEVVVSRSLRALGAPD